MKTLQPPAPAPGTEEDLIVVTAWASHAAFDAWIDTGSFEVDATEARARRDGDGTT